MAAGHDVVVFDDLYQGHREAVPPEADALYRATCATPTRSRGCSRSTRASMGLCTSPRYTLVGESMQQPLLYLRENLVAGANLFEQAVAHNVGRFILSSTANLFDDPGDHADRARTTGSCLARPHGESKLFLERTLHWFDRIYGLKYACLRYFNASGDTAERGEHHEPELHLIPVVLEVALGKREQVTIFGGDYPTQDGTCVRDYVHVLDLAQAHILAMGALDQLGSRKYNLGNGNGFSVNQRWSRRRAKITGHAIPHTIGPRRPGDPATLVASSDKIRAELGWQTRHSSIEQIIGSAWDWHSRHPHGYGH